MWVAKRGQLFGRISSLCRQGKGREMGTKQMLARPALAFVQLLPGLKAREGSAGLGQSAPRPVSSEELSSVASQASYQGTGTASQTQANLAARDQLHLNEQHPKSYPKPQAPR